jgi:hypothetical protein
MEMSFRRFAMPLQMPAQIPMLFAARMSQWKRRRTPELGPFDPKLLRRNLPEPW